MAKEWLDNAFWENEKKELLNCISIDYDDDGKEIRQVHKLRKLTTEGKENPLFKDCIAFLGEEAIDKETKERIERKNQERDLAKTKAEQKNRAQRLEGLFQYKLEIFEIPEIKASKNRTLRSKLRRSKSVPEANLYAMMIMKEMLDAAE